MTDFINKFVSLGMKCKNLSDNKFLLFFILHFYIICPLSGRLAILVVKAGWRGVVPKRSCSLNPSAAHNLLIPRGKPWQNLKSPPAIWKIQISFHMKYLNYIKSNIMHVLHKISSFHITNIFPVLYQILKLY